MNDATQTHHLIDRNKSTTASGNGSEVSKRLVPASKSDGYLNKCISSIYQQSSFLLSSLQLQKTFNYCFIRARELLNWAFFEPLITDNMYDLNCPYESKTKEQRFRSNKFLFSLAYQARIRIPFIIASLFLLFNLPMVRIEIDIDININNNN